MSKTRFVIPAALALAGTLSMGAAQARDVDVRWSVTIGSPIYASPLPVYVEPQAVYVEPQPVYVQPRPVYGVTVPFYRVPAHLVGRYHAPTYWDRDGDGIPNRYDRVYNPRRDRDGDGIPNRYDHHPRNGWRP
jgi:hypothetical protein